MGIYDSFKNLGNKLLTKFGAVCYLYRRTDTGVEKYTGIAAKFNYESEAIGMNNNVIKAGDAKILCQFSVTPVETDDYIEFAGENFNIVTVSEVSPDNTSKVIYELQVRRRG